MCRACTMHTRARAHGACACACASARARWGMRHAARARVHVCTPGYRWESGSTRGCTTATASKSSIGTCCGIARQAPPTHPSPWRNASPLAPLRVSLAPALLRPPAQRHHPNSRPGRTSPPLTLTLTQTLTLTRTSPSPSASTSTRASRTMSTRDKAHASRLL